MKREKSVIVVFFADVLFLELITAVTFSVFLLTNMDSELIWNFACNNFAKDGIGWLVGIISHA